MEERVIDLRQLIYKTLKKWRVAIVVGIICALVMAAYTAVTDFLSVKDEDDYTAAMAKYEIEHSNWAATETL